MAKTKDNFKSMKPGELEKKLVDLEESLRVIHFKAEGAKSKNVKEASMIRKDIARVKTQMNATK